jgi:hypothetical protein
MRRALGVSFFAAMVLVVFALGAGSASGRSRSVSWRLW